MLKLLIWRFLFVGFFPFFLGCAGMPKYPVNWFFVGYSLWGAHHIWP